MKKKSKEFTPNILYALCSWCGSGGSETAGAMKLKYPENVKPVRFYCTGGIDPVYIFRALLEGADGVVVSGCHPGDCHFDTGNYRARRRIASLKTILNTLGLDGDRVWLRWVGHGEGKRYVDTASEFNEFIQEKGPSPLKGVKGV